MRILYIATSFPKPEMGSTIYTDLAEALKVAGHHVTVTVTEQKRNQRHTTVTRERGLDVVRIMTGNYYDVGLIRKGITSLCIPFRMRRGIRKYVPSDKYDLVLYEAPPVTNARLVKWAKRRFRCPSYLMLKDIFPQNAVDIGIMKKGSLLHRYFRMKEKQLYESASIIGCMSEANRKYILESEPGLNADKVELFPNTICLRDSAKSDVLSIRKKYSIPEDACVFLFGGNMGRPQCVDLLCKSVVALKEDKNLFFLFVGRGTDRCKLEKTIRENGVENAISLCNMHREEFESIACAADVGLVVLDPRFTIPNYPSRILTYMKYGKPVLAATDRVTDLRELISGADCGQWVWSGDPEAFIAAVREIADSSRLADMGNNGRIYAERNFPVQKSVEILESHFALCEQISENESAAVEQNAKQNIHIKKKSLEAVRG